MTHPADSHQHVRLTFPPGPATEPVIYEIVTRFSVVPNIRRASIQDHTGWMVLDLGGDPAKVDEAIDCYFAPLVSSPRRKAQAHAYALALERNALSGIEAALKRSTIPTRIVWGTGDTIFSPASPDYLDRSFGNSLGVRRLEGSKLFWPEERPDVVAEEARKLWKVA